MNFDFINSLITNLEATNVFKYTIVGFKALAFAILTLKIIDKLVKNVGREEIPIGEIYSLLGIMLLIGGSDFIIQSIEGIFNGLQNEMHLSDDGKIDSILGDIKEQQKLQSLGAEGVMESVLNFFDNFFSNILLCLVIVLSLILKIVDLSVTMSYLLLRIFYLQLLKFLFPIVLALSTFDSNLNFLQSWIKRYIGVYILGIAYIGIGTFSKLVMNSLSVELTLDAIPLTTLTLSSLVVVIIVINLKIQLFSRVTSYITGMFQ